jgi:two-component system sensor histidine kinase MprB
MSLRWRIAAALGAVAALVMAFGAIAAYVSTSRNLRDSVDESLLARAADYSRIPRELGPPGNRTTASQDDDDEGFQRPSGCPQAGAFAPATAAQFVDVDGTVTKCIEGSPALPVDAADRSIAHDGGASVRLRTVDVKGEQYRLVTSPRLGGGAFLAARSLNEVDDVLSSLQLRLGVIGAIGVGAAVLAGWLIAGRIVRPIGRLRATAEEIARTQDLTTTVPVEGPAEIGSLSRSFTTMVDALATSRQEQQRLVGDASHELRTPLTSLQTNAELLARADELAPEEYAAVVQGVQLEVGELSDLVSELVELASDRAGGDEPLERVELADLARDVTARARRRSGRDITLVTAGATTVDVRPQAIERAMANLVDNALKYGAADWPVEVVVDGTRLEVRDHGEGFSDDDLPHVFDRFYRSVAARTQSGSGLGLAIVRQAVERHGGRVWAANRHDGVTGAVVGFELPAAPPD